MSEVACQEKTCRKCGVMKPLEAYYRDKSRKDGYRDACKTCKCACDRERYIPHPRAAYVPVTEKACRKCGVVKPLEAFYPDKNSVGGYRQTCKACKSAQDHLRRPPKPRVYPVYVPVSEKACGKCGVVTPLEGFYQNKGFRDGRSTECIECRKIYKRTPEAKAGSKRYYYSENGQANERKFQQSGRRTVTSRERRKRPEVAAKIKERQPAYAAKYNQSEKGKATLKAKRMRPATKAWFKTYMARPEIRERTNRYARIAVQRRNNKKKLLPATFTSEDWVVALEHFGHRCAYCGTDDPLAQEHFIPLSKGGGYTPDNIVPACKSCNSSKKNKMPEVWCEPDAYERATTYLLSRIDLCRNLE